MYIINQKTFNVACLTSEKFDFHKFVVACVGENLGKTAKFGLEDAQDIDVFDEKITCRTLSREKTWLFILNLSILKMSYFKNRHF